MIRGRPHSTRELLTGSSISVIQRWKKSAFLRMKLSHFAGTSDAMKMADTGHAGSQAPQSVHAAGSIYI